MRQDWISDPVLWIIALPALAATGLLVQMVLALFRCCGAFTLQGRPIQLRWWMIPATGGVCVLLWGVAVGYLVLV